MLVSLLTKSVLSFSWRELFIARHNMPDPVYMQEISQTSQLIDSIDSSTADKGVVDIPVKENAGLLTGSVYFEGVDRDVIFTTSTSEFLLLQKGNGEFNIPLGIDSTHTIFGKFVNDTVCFSDNCVEDFGIFQINRIPDSRFEGVVGFGINKNSVVQKMFDDGVIRKNVIDFQFNKDQPKLMVGGYDDSSVTVD